MMKFGIKLRILHLKNNYELRIPNYAFSKSPPEKEPKMKNILLPVLATLIFLSFFSVSAEAQLFRRRISEPQNVSSTAARPTPAEAIPAPANDVKNAEEKKTGSILETPAKTPAAVIGVSILQKESVGTLVLEPAKDDAEDPEEDDEDDTYEEVIVAIPFEMEGTRQVTGEELSGALALPAQRTAESLAEFIFEADALDPSAGSDEASRKAFFSKVAAAKWSAAQEMLKMKDLSPEMLALAVETLLSVAFFEPEIYLEQVKTLPAELRKRNSPAEAWKVEEGLLQLDASLLQQKEMKSPEEKAKLMVKLCHSLIAHLEKGLQEEVAGDMDVLILAVQLQTYTEAFPAAQRCELYSVFYPLTEDREDFDVKRVGLLMKNAVVRLEAEGKTLKMTLTPVSGNAVKIQDFGGKLLLIYFWSPENEISMRELPILLELYDFYHEKGLEIVGVVPGESDDALETLLETVNFPWETVVQEADESAWDESEEAEFERWRKTPAVRLK